MAFGILLLISVAVFCAAWTGLYMMKGEPKNFLEEYQQSVPPTERPPEATTISEYDDIMDESEYENERYVNDDEDDEGKRFRKGKGDDFPGLRGLMMRHKSSSHLAQPTTKLRTYTESVISSIAASSPNKNPPSEMPASGENISEEKNDLISYTAPPESGELSKKVEW